MLCSSVSTSKQVQTMTVEFAVDLGSFLSWRMPTGFACDQQLVPMPVLCPELTNLTPSFADCIEIQGTLIS